MTQFKVIKLHGMYWPVMGLWFLCIKGWPASTGYILVVKKKIF